MITVLTATYNREKTLQRLFDSLCAQTSKRFEWVVIDDGSQDETQKLLLELSNCAPFRVRIIRQENSGKHVALNKGFVLAEAPWVFVVDSDDALIPDAVSIVEESLLDLDSKELVGVCYRRAYFNMNVIGGEVELDDSPVIMTPSEAGHFFKGDLAYIFKRDALLKYPFPVVKGEKFVPELYIWNKVGDDGDIYFYNKPIYLCDYLDDGYSKNFSSCLRKNPIGFLIHYWGQIYRERSFFYKLKNFIRACQCCFYIFINRLV